MSLIYFWVLRRRLPPLILKTEIKIFQPIAFAIRESYLCTMEDLTVIIPALNCQDILLKTIASLSKNCVLPDLKIEVIVVDDGSDVPIICPPGIKVIRHSRNLGVGAAFDTGVKAAKTDNLVLMGADILVQPMWDERVMSILGDYPMALTCSVCSGFNTEDQAFMPGRHLRYGAHILKYHETPMHKHTQTDIIQAQWNRAEPDWDADGMARIGCILGAFYVTTKRAFTSIGGFMGHRLWGGLEPMISIRAKRSGLPLYVAGNLETAHNYGRLHKTHERTVRWDVILYNKMFMAHTMFEDPSELMGLLYKHGPNNWLSVASKRILNSMADGTILDVREFHR